MVFWVKWRILKQSKSKLYDSATLTQLTFIYKKAYQQASIQIKKEVTPENLKNHRKRPLMTLNGYPMSPTIQSQILAFKQTHKANTLQTKVNKLR
jgi:hypothetical protein